MQKFNLFAQEDNQKNTADSFTTYYYQQQSPQNSPQLEYDRNIGKTMVCEEARQMIYTAWQAAVKATNESTNVDDEVTIHHLMQKYSNLHPYLVLQPIKNNTTYQLQYEFNNYSELIVSINHEINSILIAHNSYFQEILSYIQKYLQDANEQGVLLYENNPLSFNILIFLAEEIYRVTLRCWKADMLTIDLPKINDTIWQIKFLDNFLQQIISDQQTNKVIDAAALQVFTDIKKKFGKIITILIGKKTNVISRMDEFKP